MSVFLSIGEVMVQLFEAGSGQWRLGFGGDTLNTAWYARAALPKAWQVNYFTRLGSEQFSDEMERFLIENGIETTYIRRETNRNIGLYAIRHDEDGELNFSYWRGQSAARRLADDPELLAQAFDAADVIHLSGITLAILPPAGRTLVIGEMRRAKAAGKIVSFDPNIRVRLWEDKPTMLGVIMQASTAATLVFPSFADERDHIGDATPEDCAKRWRAVCKGEVVVKNGANGVVLADADGIRHFPIEPVTPIDTTAAGDSFNAGYLAARLQGQSAADAVAAGHAMALRVLAYQGALIPMAELTAS